MSKIYSKILFKSKYAAPYNNGSITEKKAQPKILHSSNMLEKNKQFGEKSNFE
jgi:hypothetical protein